MKKILVLYLILGIAVILASIAAGSYEMIKSPTRYFDEIGGLIVLVLTLLAYGLSIEAAFRNGLLMTAIGFLFGTSGISVYMGSILLQNGPYLLISTALFILGSCLFFIYEIGNPVKTKIPDW